MESKRYWWIRYSATLKELIGEYERVIDIHPFIWCNQSHIKLLLWQSISVEEYNLFNELNNKQ